MISKGLILKLSPGELLLESCYFTTAEGSEGNIIKRITNVKRFVFPDYWKSLLLMDVQS